MKILITGANGQVGWELIRQAESRDIDFCAFTRTELDITKIDAVEQAIANCKPDIVVNAAAYTAVDKAEEQPELAIAVNRDGVANLAKACKVAAIPMIHISTDYVFDGTKEGAYTEEDDPNPLGVYGKSKQAGEEALGEMLPHHIILRTSWVFSSHGNNFVKTILRLAREREELRVVADQYGCPTSAQTIAEAILHVAPQLMASTQKSGTYHFCQPEPTNWHGFAEAIVNTANKFTHLTVKKIKPITTDEFPTRAKRPANSILYTGKFIETFEYSIPSWDDSLHTVTRDCVNDLTG
jgi:dTDP-4-dehydrorhamnose reductase